ncbi:MAG: beta-1,6-N-acetylglucosaminyltransferase [Clostridia bacterium]|nr:beta-1,6-N-acetylglucosaminyltransferase [Clostridia bacterium]
MKRHAYLIIVHQHLELLERLIRVLDSDAADFYIHIDRRVREVDESRLLACMERSHGRIFRRYKITWGADTLVRCEMFLLKQAARGRYDYYHMLSGTDIPLKTGAQIEAFFEQQTDSFIEFKEETDHTATLERVRYYYPLQNLIGRPVKDGGIWRGLLDQLSYECIKVQRALGIDRTKGAPFAYCRGSNWFSLSDELTQYVVQNERLVRRYFYHCMVSDEMFLQCVACASPYRQRIVRDNLRLIDWQRTEHDGCSPHTFTMEDWPQLIDSGKLWARKFDPRVDQKVIDALYARLEAGKDAADGRG